MNEVIALFKTREQAIKQQDPQLYESTQLESSMMWNGNFGIYRSVKDIKIEILSDADNEVDLSKYVFVKEACRTVNGLTFLRFAMYGLVHTVKGWKIISTSSSPMPNDYAVRNLDNKIGPAVRQ